MGRLGHSGATVAMRQRLFPAGFGGEVMQLVVQTWKTFRLHHAVTYEEPITALFRTALIAAYVAAGRNWFVTLEDPVTDAQFGTELGRNDLRFHPPQHYGQTVFFTVECKRLHILRPPSEAAVAKAVQAGRKIPPSRFHPLTEEYVTEGMQRFVDELYSANLPCGAMVGYVMDDDLAAALAGIKKQIKRFRSKLRMSTERMFTRRSNAIPNWPHGIDTEHSRNGGAFVLHHALLGISDARIPSRSRKPTHRKKLQSRPIR